MSSLERLVTELAPDGVQHKYLADLVDYVRGVTYSKQDEQSDGPIRVLRSNNITLSSNTLNFDDVKTVAPTVRVRDNQRLYANDILISAASGSKAHVGKVAFIWEDIDYVFGGFMAVLRASGELEPRYLFHLLVGGTFARYLDGALSSTTINNLNSALLGGFRVPVPPLEVQREIVRILDCFTALQTSLETELESRRRQFAHVRGTVLTFDQQADVTWGRLGEVAKIRNGRDYKHLSSGEVPVYGSGGIMTTVDTPCFTRPSVLIPRKGSIGNLFYVDGPFWTVDTIFWTEIDAAVVNPRFLYHYLKTQDLASMNTAGGIPSLTQSALNPVPIPIPSLAEQERIVGILDKFDALVNDLNVGLPAELAARRKQYEYYRDKLLTFKESAA